MTCALAPDSQTLHPVSHTPPRPSALPSRGDSCRSASSAADDRIHSGSRAWTTAGSGWPGAYGVAPLSGRTPYSLTDHVTAREFPSRQSRMPRNFRSRANLPRFSRCCRRSFATRHILSHLRRPESEERQPGRRADGSGSLDAPDELEVSTVSGDVLDGPSTAEPVGPRARPNGIVSRRKSQPNRGVRSGGNNRYWCPTS